MKIFFKGSEGDSSFAGGQTIQYAEMPTASADLAGKIVQYVGTTNTNYTNGYFYKCVLQAGVYKWEPKTVQTGGGGGGDVPIATTETPGIVKPDGITITVDNDGTIHSIGGGSADFPAGGTTGQALVKASNADNDVEWGDMPTVPIEKITVNGTEQAITNKTVAITVITETVNNLVNYYTKTETYTREQVHQIISATSFGGFEVVATLPTTDISTKTIYLVPKSPPETGNVYDEFIYVNNSWENIGDTEIDLTVYQTKNLSSPITVGGVSQITVESALSAINALFASYLTTSTFNMTIAGYYTKTQVDAVTGDLTDLETTDKSSLVGAINELNTAVRPRTEIEISTANDFRSVGQGAFAFITTTAVTITLADANTVTIPANTQGFFDVGETDKDINDYTGVIQYVVNDYAKTIYFNKTVFRLPASDSVQIDDVNTSTATTYSSAKIETVIGSSKASQMTGATAYQDGKAGLATKPVAGDNQKALFGDGQYHTIYAANTGSTIVVVTNEPTLYGRPVTLTAGSTTLTGTFSNTGECTFHNLAVYGAVSISSSDQEGNLAKGSTNITYFGTYVVGVGFNFATIKFTSSDISLAGVPVAIYKNDILVAETSLSIVGSGQLEAVAYVEELGTYRAIARTSNGTARAKITITSLRQTYVVELIDANVYGFQINHLDSNPVTCVQPYNLDDYDVINADFAPAHMDYENDAFDYGSWGALATCDRSQVFFAPKPCMLRYDGTVDYYLNPNDYTKKLDGTASDVADFNYEGNCMIELPTVWFKRWEDGNYSYILIADKQVDIDFHAYAHHDVNGNVMPFIYRAVYDGSYDGTRLRSISGVDCHNTTTLTIDKIMSYTTRLEEMNYAKANNTSTEKGEGWFILHKAEWDYINDILILIGMSTDTQTTFGRGRDSGYSSSSKTGIISTGTMNNKGLFWGENAGAGGVKVLGFENPWGNLFKSCVGWCYVNGIQKIKCTYGTEDSSTVEGYNTDATGYQIISSSSSGVTGSSGGYISGWIYGTFGFIPTIAKGSSSTYRADGLWYASGNKFALVGGSSDYKLLCGATSVSLYNASDVRNWWVGAALSYKGVAS